MKRKLSLALMACAAFGVACDDQKGPLEPVEQIEDYGEPVNADGTLSPYWGIWGTSPSLSNSLPPQVCTELAGKLRIDGNLVAGPKDNSAYYLKDYRANRTYSTVVGGADFKIGCANFVGFFKLEAAVIQADGSIKWEKTTRSIGQMDEACNFALHDVPTGRYRVNITMDSPTDAYGRWGLTSHHGTMQLECDTMNPSASKVTVTSGVIR